MSLTRIQRDAMARAQNGDWELADAIEILARADARKFGDCLGGIRQGGRLQLVVYGTRHDQGCHDDECGGCDELDAAPDTLLEAVALVTDLNDRVLFRAFDGSNDGYPPPPMDYADLTLPHACAVVEAYLAAVARPTQQTLIPEPA